MYFSAKRGLGITITCRLSVCLSVCNVGIDCDHIGWNSSKIISLLVSLGCSLSSDPNKTGLRRGKHPEIWAQSDPPPVDWASEKFDGKLRPNGYLLITDSATITMKSLTIIVLSNGQPSQFFPYSKQSSYDMTVISLPACYFTISTDWTVSVGIAGG